MCRRRTERNPSAEAEPRILQAGRPVGDPLPSADPEASGALGGKHGANPLPLKAVPADHALDLATARDVAQATGGQGADDRAVPARGLDAGVEVPVDLHGGNVAPAGAAAGIVAPVVVLVEDVGEAARDQQGAEELGQHGVAGLLVLLLRPGGAGEGRGEAEEGGDAAGYDGTGEADGEAGHGALLDRVVAHGRRAPTVPYPYGGMERHRSVMRNPFAFLAESSDDPSRRCMTGKEAHSVRHMARILLVALVAAILPAAVHAACYADYKARAGRTGNLQLHYGTAELQGACDVQSAARELAPRLEDAGWTLLTVVSVFDEEELEEKAESAGRYHLRY